jgi:glycolate oxidase iron-sulfur subunit
MSNAIELLRAADHQRRLDQCVHCGLCLQACPTYRILGTETDSPRGRIALMRAAADGRIDDLSGSFAHHIDLCLACRACESACPSGVPYGALVEVAHAALAHEHQPGPGERLLRWLGLRQLMPHLGRLKLLARAMTVYQRLGLPRLARRMTFLPRPLQAMEQLLPPLTLEFGDYRQPAPAHGPRRGRVAFFTGCIQEAFLSQVNAATVRVLQRNGYEVVAPQLQTCCGAAQTHSGDLVAARDLARRNLDAFFALGCDAIICNAGGCGVSLKEYAHLLRDDPDYATRAAWFTARVQDVSEFLATHLHEAPQGRVRARATYADSCHLRHGQRVLSQPRALLRAIPGIELVELKHPDQCCGSAGVYNIAHPEMAETVLQAKLDDIAATGANLVVVANTGCHMQLIAGVRQAGLTAQVKHLVEVLDESYRAEATPALRLVAKEVSR